MNQEDLNKFVDQFGNLAKKGTRKALSDEELSNINGGLGGYNEATCPKCGTPMPKNGSSWVCGKCGITQFLSDGEYIEILKAAIAAGQTNGLVIPVWWNKIK